MFHGATISLPELDEIRRVTQVIRLGYIHRIERDRIVLAEGEVPTTPATVHIDCTARVVNPDPEVPIFQDGLITLQTVRMVQPVFSAAFAAHVDLTYDGDKAKNRLCQIVPLPDHHTDWIAAQAAQMMNQLIWGQDKELTRWLSANRLDGFSGFIRDAIAERPERQQIFDRIKAAGPDAMKNLIRMKLELEAA